MLQSVRPLTLPEEAKRRLKIMFIAKHAKWGGGLHPEDGNHALYHVEVREILQGLGLNLVLENRYEALFDKPDVDFVFPLLNRGGFLNSEMMLPLLCTRHGIPFLGASPILRGISDDKHSTKLEAKARGVPTSPWAIYRRGAPVREADCPLAERMVFEQADPSHLRTYYEKRDLVDRAQKYRLIEFDDAEWQPRIDALTRKMVDVFRPFDYGRYEFRLDLEKGEVRMLEVNLNCNLWSEKVYGRSAKAAGWTQEQLIETILCESLRRHGLLG